MADPRCQLALEWVDAGGVAQRVTFDASVRENYELTAEATEHAVERGVVIADHVKRNPEGLTLDAVVTNAPIVDPQDHADGAVSSVRSASVQAGGRTVSVNTRQWSAPFDRVRGVDTELRALRDAGQLLTVVTGLRTIESMVIARYAPERSSPNGDALHFTLELKKLRIATTQRVNAPRRVRPPQNRGPQPAEPVELNSAFYNGATGALNLLGLRL